MKKITPSLTIEKALKTISNYTKYRIEKVKTQNSLGRYTAKKIISPENFPSFERSLFDGFALRSKDTYQATNRRPINFFLKESPSKIQKKSFSLSRGEVTRISTGGVLPKGTDAVVMLENVRTNQKSITISTPLYSGENTTRPGEDIKKGELLFLEKWKLRPQDIGLLLGLGVKEISVFKKISVAIISSGNEIVPFNKRPGHNKVRDMNSQLLINLVRTYGGQPLSLGICPDKKKEIINILRKALEKKVELIIFSGGTSMGKSDLLSAALRSIPGSKILFHGLKAKPGKPTLAAAINSNLIIGLPGRPNSAFVVFHFLVKPILNYFSPSSKIIISAVLAEGFSHHPPDREEYISVVTGLKKETYYAWPLSSKPALFSPLVFSHGTVKVPLGQKTLKKGKKVKVTLW